MIKSFRHKGLERFFTTGSKAGIQPKHATRVAYQLAVLDEASGPEDMNIPGWRCHELQGEDTGRWTVRVNGNWRLTFVFEKTDAVLLNYEDYH